MRVNDCMDNERGGMACGWGKWRGMRLRRKWGVEGLFWKNEMEMYFSTCPSRRRMVLIWDRKSGSCVVGV
jgi:hypothetical protein